MDLNVLVPELEMIANRGAEQASDSLSSLLNLRIKMSVTKIEKLDVEAFFQTMGDESKPVVGLLTETMGDITGCAFLILGEEDAITLTSSLGGNGSSPADDGFGELERSILEETTNITISSFTNSLSNHLDQVCIPGPPHYSFDLEGAFLSSVIMDALAESDDLFYISALFSCQGKDMDVTLGFLPTYRSMESMECHLIGDE